MNNPLVSLIVPLYNRAPLIGETIDSLNKQSYNNIEVIIIDDGSTDNSFDVAFSFMVQDKKIKVVRRPSNLSKGANSCRNFGLSLASGRYIKWIDSDDLLSPTAIEVQVNNLMNTNADVSICKALKFVQKEKNGEKVFLSEWGKIDTFPSIDNFCKSIEEKTGMDDYRSTLGESVAMAKKIIDKVNEKARRIKEADEILKNICLN